MRASACRAETWPPGRATPGSTPTSATSAASSSGAARMSRPTHRPAAISSPWIWASEMMSPTDRRHGTPHGPTQGPVQGPRQGPMHGAGRRAAPVLLALVSAVTGESFAGAGDLFMGPSVWDFYFNAIKGIDTIIGNIGAITVPTASGSGPLPATQQEALFGAMETLKAMYYMYIAQTRDTLGVPVNEVGHPIGAPPTPILCARDVWSQIVAMLDSANDSLTVAGSATAFPVA